MSNKKNDIEMATNPDSAKKDYKTSSNPEISTKNAPVVYPPGFNPGRR